MSAFCIERTATSLLLLAEARHKIHIISSDSAIEKSRLVNGSPPPLRPLSLILR